MPFQQRDAIAQSVSFVDHCIASTMGNALPAIECVSSFVSVHDGSCSGTNPHTVGAGLRKDGFDFLKTAALRDFSMPGVGISFVG